MAGRRSTGLKKTAQSKADGLLALMIQRDAAARIEGEAVRVEGERARFVRADVEDLVARDLAGLRQDIVEPTEAGRAFAKRQAGAGEFRLQHGEVCREASGTMVDLAESPLLWLHRRRDASGRPLIGDAMFAAGERLRADFTFGNMTPRVTLNWSAAVQSSRNPDAGEPSESALAARQRVRRALERVGPELSGILIDVCCFLKKLEDIERDRHWPARSAKVILALGLERLARHYGYSDVAEGRDLRRAG